MENQLTRTTCLSIYTDSKQDRCGKSMLRLATFVILFLCSMTISWAQETTTGNDSKVILKDAISPTITLNSDKTNISELSFTITVSTKNEEQTGTYLVTYYTTDGSDPEVNGKELSENSEVVKVTWKEGDKVKVRAFTKRVDDNDASNYDESKETTQDFHNTGSADLPCVDDPIITPGDQAVVAGKLEVTIKHDQWTEATKDKLKIFYIIYERDGNGNTTNTDWQQATTLPLTLTLNNSSTVKAYAKFNNVKYDEVSRTYILLDKTTTYLNVDNTKEVGTTVEQNGMTMTYGGIADGTNKFIKFSNVDYSEDNILGSLHAVTGTPLYLNDDAKSESDVLYKHKEASTQKPHEKTFGLPAKGCFYKFEPEVNGSLTVFVEQQGAMVKSKGDLNASNVRKRPVYFLDETGKSIKADYAYTSSKINKADWENINITPDGAGKEYEYMTKLKAYYQGIIDGTNTTFTNINSAVAEADKRAKLELGTSIQPVIVLNEKCNEAILEEDANNDKTGYMTISEGYVTYRFSVKAGKTYYLFASGTKLALSGFKFKQDESYDTNVKNVTLKGNVDNASTISGLTEDNQYNVTLNRSFGKNKWYAVVLPFSVSQKQMKDVFGNEVKILHYDNVEGTTLNLTEHFYKMVVGGTPVFVKPSKDDVKDPVFKNVTLTSKDVVAIESSGFKCTGSWDNEDFPAYSYFINAIDNKFYLYDPTQVAAGKKPHAGAFRAWIISTSDNQAGAAQLNMRINGIEDNDETTAIWNAISADDDNSEVGSKDIYSLSGQKMNTTDTRSLPKGMYIVNGKKFIIK